MAEKRVIEYEAASELANDDWLLIDGVTEGTRKARPSTVTAELGTQVTNLASTVGGLTAELVDIRVGANGATYPSAGDAVRTQVKYLEDKVTQLQAFETRNIFTLDGATYGKYIAQNGTIGINANTGYTDYIDLSSFANNITFSILVSQYSVYNAHQWAYYDENKNYISGIEKSVNEDTDFNVVTPINAKYVRFSFFIDRENDYYIKGITKISQNSLNITNDIFTTIGATLNYYCRGTDGAIIATNGVGCTDFIDVSNYNLIITNKPDKTMRHQGALFDKDYNYISGYDVPQYISEININVPQNAKYIRFSYVLSDESSYYANAEATDINKVIENLLENTVSDSDYADFKVNCLGDSITYGYIPDSGAQMSAPYPTQLKDILGLNTCRNYGISGSSLAVNSGNYNPMCIRYADMDNDANIVLVFGGTNDYGRAVYTPNLGTINDTVNTTIYGALNILTEGLIEKYPKALIFYITPLRRADKTGNNGGGYNLEQVANAIKEVAYKYSIPVLDLYSKGGFHIENATFRSYYGGNDKLHPSQSFVTEHLAPMIAKFIESNI